MRVLMPRQHIASLGLMLNLVLLSACLSPNRVDTFKSTLAQFVMGKWVTYGLCLRLLGLMASPLLVVRLGRL